MNSNPTDGQEARRATESRPPAPSFPIVGVGASAGGLKAFSEFFAGLPGDPGMAFVLIQHLAPNHESELAALLHNHTPLRVIQVTDGVKVEAGGVYVIPPDTALSITRGVLHLAEPPLPHGRRAPIDDFFRSLAADQGERAVCVVLSGTGSDGTLGLKTVKEAGGLTMAQDPDDAEYDGMPRSAVGAGLVDVVLPARQLSGRLVELRLQGASVASPIEADAVDAEALAQIFARLRDRTGHDFSRYKQTTVLRRIGRRMQVARAADLDAYLQILRDDAREVETLLKDLLISVTYFFRDPEAFAVLEREAIPALFEGKGADDQVRVWVPGCATGEEAYSIAILLHEHAGTLDRPPKLQVFATDIDEEALAHARAGVYPEGIAADVSPERLDRFFDREAGGYRVRDSIRECVLFAAHNLLKDPPFAKLDLISCRNLLIYLQRDTQQRIFELFAYALREPGFLFLGTSESVENASDLFTAVAKQRRLLQVRNVMRHSIRLPIMPPLRAFATGKETPPDAASDGDSPASLDDLHRRLLLTHHAPPSVLVSRSHEIVHVAGDVNRYLSFASGRPTNNLLKVVRNGLRPELRTALFQAFEQGRTTDRLRVRAHVGGESVYVVLTVRPLRDSDGSGGLVQVVFEEEPAPEDAPLPADREESRALEHLEDELQRTKTRLQNTIEEYETSTEEIKASNEELLSMNEELQSTTEELETGREELQSLNEELVTVNQELKTKIDELNRANADLKNLINSTDVATLFLDRELCINRYTPRLGELFNVLPTDRGRPIAHLTQKIAYAAFIDDARTVLDTLVPVEREVTADDGRRFLTHIVPYRTVDEEVDGVVATFLDITRRAEAEETARRREARFRRVVADAPIPIILHAEDGEILQISRALTEITGYEPADLPTRNAWLERAYGEGGARVAESIERLYELDARIDEGEYEIHTRDGGTRVWQFSSSPVGTDRRGRRLVVSMAADVTERKRAEEALRLALDGGRLGTWARDIETGIVTFDARCRRLYGMPEDAPAEEALARVHPDDRTAIEAAIEAAIDPAGSGEYDVEHRLLGSDGKVFWLSVRGRTTFRGEGEQRRPAKLAGVVLDVTARKLIEAEQDAHAEQQAALAAFGLYALAETDLQALFERAVAVVHETLAADCTKVLELLPGGDALLLRVGTGWKPGIAGVATVPTDSGSQAGYTLTVAEPVVVVDLASETRFQGPALLTDHGVVSGMSVVIGGLNDPFGVLGTHTREPRAFTPADAQFLQSVANVIASAIDRIEAYQQLEERVEERTRTLREEKEFSEYVIESSFDGIVMFDLEQRYTAWSAGMERIAGMPREQVLGRITYEVFPFLKKGEVADAQRAALRGQTTIVRDQSFDVPETGRRGYFEAQYSPLRNAAGEIVGGIGINRDVTEQKNAQEQIARSEQLLAGVLIGSLDGVVALEAVRDAEGHIEDFVWRLVNPTAAAVYGHRAEDLIGSSYLSFFPAVREIGVFDTFVRVCETGTPYRDEVFYDADGVTGWFDFTVVKLGDGVAQTFRDITEQKEAEVALRESEARFRELFEGSPDAIFVESLDGVVLDVNPAACRLHNASRAWLIGRSLGDLVPPEYRADAKRDFDRLARGELKLLESRSYTADGFVVPVEVRTDQITYGGQAAVLLHVRDVTEREAAERALRESEERFAKAFHASPIAVSISTLRDTRFIDVNESFCELTGYTRDELIGRTAAEMGLSGIFADRAHLLDQLRTGGPLRDLEFQLQTKSGESRDIIASAELIEIGGATCLLGLGFDATQRKRLEREVIEAAELERRRIGQDLHDELGQQLTGAAFLGQVLTQKLEAQSQPEAGDARQLTELINRALAEMRDLSRLLSPVDVQAEGLMDALQELADQTERVFGVACWLRTEGDVRVSDNAAATHLYRIAQEAVNNAVKHAEATEIEIALTHDETGLRVEIRDDGIGIASAMLQQPTGLGLRTMQYRAALIGAQLQIGGTEGGSVVAVFLPEARADGANTP